MNTLPLKKTIRYPVHTNAKLTEDVGRDLETLSLNGIDVGELKRAAITEAVKKALRILDKKSS